VRVGRGVSLGVGRGVRVGRGVALSPPPASWVLPARSVGSGVGRDSGPELGRGPWVSGASVGSASDGVASSVGSDDGLTDGLGMGDDETHGLTDGEGEGATLGTGDGDGDSSSGRMTRCSWTRWTTSFTPTAPAHDRREAAAPERHAGCLAERIARLCEP